MIRIVLLLGLTLLALPPSQSAAADCPGNPAALGTERVLADRSGADRAGRPQAISARRCRWRPRRSC